MMLYGDYGAGKSHALFWAQNKILYGEKTHFDAVCYFIPTLRKKGGKLTFSDAFSEDIVANSNLVADVLAFCDFLKGCIDTYSKAKGSGCNQTDEQIIEELIPIRELYNFVKGIYACDNSNDLLKFLDPPKLTDYEAMIYFTRIVNIFVHEMKISDTDTRRFKKGAYLFIDELDDLLRVNLQEARAVNDILRHIYDRCPHYLCMVIAFSADVVQKPVLFAQYVLTRVHKEIELAHLNANDAIVFVKEILATSRVNANGEDDFFPFEEAAVASIISQFREITPRKIVNTMQQVIEEARIAGHNPEDGPVSFEFLDVHGIIDEVLPDFEMLPD